MAHFKNLLFGSRGNLLSIIKNGNFKFNALKRVQKYMTTDKKTSQSTRNA